MRYLDQAVRHLRAGVRSLGPPGPITVLLASASAVALCIVLLLFPQHRGLLMLFLYALPAEFVIAVVPHEPVIFYFSKLYDPLTVAWVTLAGTLLVEYVNYLSVTLVLKIPRLDDLRKRRTFQTWIRYFMLAPFISLVVAALTPIPFYPFRVIAAASKYSVRRYLVAVFVGRGPRFYLLAYFGHALGLSNRVILLLFALLCILLVIAWMREKAHRKPFEVDAC